MALADIASETMSTPAALIVLIPVRFQSAVLVCPMFTSVPSWEIAMLSVPAAFHTFRLLPSHVSRPAVSIQLPPDRNSRSLAAAPVVSTLDIRLISDSPLAGVTSQLIA
jgi:hypothetical protein